MFATGEKVVDPIAERAVLSGLCKYGSNVYLDICDYVQESSFSSNSNKCIFKCLSKICKEECVSVDFPTILSTAKELGINHILERKDELSHLKSILELPVEEENVKRFAAKIRKLEIARLISQQGDTLKQKMSEVKGDEPISQIISLAEDCVFDFTSLLIEGDDIKPFGHFLEEHTKYLEENPVEQPGLSTFLRRWDKALGGGQRRGAVSLFGIRSGHGKSMLSLNLCYDFAKRQIPALTLDTEMTKEDNAGRYLARAAQISINDAETGRYSKNGEHLKRVHKAVEEGKEIPYYHKTIAGMPFENQLSTMRRWIQKSVGLNQDGTAKDCVIILDYLKLMDTTGLSKDLKEFQLLGFMMTALHNFAVRYKIPIIVFIQLNRDGIQGEGADTVSGSDRILWLCSNYSIMKPKSDDELQEDGIENGTHKIVIIKSRHGAGLQNGDYINIHMQGWKATVTEGKLKSETGNIEEGNGFVIEDQQEIPFE